MMKGNDQYFLITKEMLPENCQIFPFKLFLYNSANGQYSIFLEQGSLLDDEKMELLDKSLSSGGSLAVSFKQKKTFLREADIEESEVPDLQETKSALEASKDEELTKLIESEDPDLPKEAVESEIRELVQQCLDEDDFSYLIHIAKREILKLDVNVSPTLSLAIKLSSKILNEDNETNRVVSICFFVAMYSGLKKQEDLGDIIMAAYLHNIGFTQMLTEFSTKPYMKIDEADQRVFQRHPGLAQHLIRKSKLEISERCMNIILDHHERIKGEGYPNQKVGQFIDPLAMILGLASHIIELADGRITGERITISKILPYLKAGSKGLQGLETGFSQHIIRQFVSFFEYNDTPRKTIDKKSSENEAA